MAKRKILKSKKQKSEFQLPNWMRNTRTINWFFFVLGFVLYANTLFHDYTQDDAIVIYDNMFTTDGISGISGILEYDTFYGFFKEAGKDKLVVGGRYRPLTLMMFAVEWELFGKNPFIGHLINVLLFALLGVLFYQLLIRLFHWKSPSDYGYLVAFISGLLFITHPVHTEVVANIKGRDEIIALMGGIGAMFLTLKALKTEKFFWNIIAAIVFFVALFSKENTIAFLALIPLALWFFTQAKPAKIAFLAIPFFVAVGLFLFVRGNVIGWQFGGAPMELMNNPFLKVEGNQYVPFSAQERFATILYTLGEYVRLAIFPHPLTHDYYPRHVEIMSMGNWKVILSALLYIGLIVYAVRGLFKRDALAFAILLFLIPLSIVSNLVFAVGTNMAERFLFMSSVGFSLAFGLLLVRLVKKQYFGLRPMLVAVLIIGLLFSGKTVSRNTVWASNFKLFTTDVKVSHRSAKLRNAVAGELIKKANSLDNKAEKRQMLLSAAAHLNEAVKIHPNYKNAYLLQGNCNYYLQDFEKSVASYQKALSIDPNYKDAKNNLLIAYRDAGRYYGEEKGELAKAIDYLNRAYEMDASDYETLRLLGVASGIQGDAEKAVKYFSKALEIKPNNADAHYNLGSAYYNAGNAAQGAFYHSKALELDPDVVNRMRRGK